MPQPTSMPRFRPVIRVFVSSTFSDLKPERNALQAKVFPKLEQLCAQNGFQFQAIDLRWGVSSEAGLDHRTMRICFDELRRAQDISPEPNFLVLLGNRYGWRPLPEEISVAEFQALERAAAQVATNTDEPAAAVLQAWYRRDDNAVPPVYLLQSRRQQLPDAKDYTQDAPWNEVQAILWEIINRAQAPEQLRGRFDAAALADGSPPAIVRFQASATEQEIWHGALCAPDAHEHVLAFFRQIENIGEFSEPAQIKDFVDLELSEKVDAALGAEQERLKNALKPRLGEKNVFTGSARLVPARDAQGQPTAGVTTDHLAQLCTDVEGRLTQIIRVQIEEYWNKTAQASTERAACELKIEQDEHERFGRERGGAKSFVGRESELQAIRDYLKNDSPWPLVVHGASGCGKTALLARAAGELQMEDGRSKMAQVVVRYIGVTPRSSDIRSLLGNLCQELRVRNPREGELPSDIKALTEELQEHFRAAKPEQPLILFLDALDQLSDADNGRLLNWIPTGHLPGHVKLVISCLSDRAEGDPAGQPFAELTRRQLPAKNIINLDALSENEASTLLFDRWLPQAGRTVSLEQRKGIGQRLKSEECRQPIYLKMLFEEARLWRSYDAAPEWGESVPAILGQLIERLRRPANHGRLLVERVLGYLTASRHGLAENEILEILFADPDYKAALDLATEQTRHELPASATRIPIAIWSRLRFDLAPYLTERAAPGANVLTFYHRQVAEWVQEHFVKTSEQSWQPHRRLADYFTACAKGTAEEWETDSVRGFAECVYQLIKAGQHEQAAGLLSNFPFLLHKLRVGLLEGVFEDYDLLRRKASATVAKQCDIWAAFFREKAHILRRGNEEWPAHKILLQLAVEHADDSPVTIEAEKWLATGKCDWFWVRSFAHLPHVQKNPCLAVFEGHIGRINGALELCDGRVLSWSGDKTLRFWDSQNGACLEVLEGHKDAVLCVKELKSGRLLSWAGDKTLRLWDGRSGACLAILEGHMDAVLDTIELKSGKLLSRSSDRTLRLWDEMNGACLAVLVGHSATVWGAMELKNERLLSWSSDKTLRLWNQKNGDCLAVLEGHTNEVRGALEVSEKRIVSWGARDKMLRFWDSQSGASLGILEGHKYELDGAHLLKSGQLLSWSSDSIRLWDTQNGFCLTVIEGRYGPICGVLELRNGHVVSWHGNYTFERDSALRLWESDTGVCRAVFWGHFEEIRDVLELSDGRLLSWSHDHSLRLWDPYSGKCLGVLNGHTSVIAKALELENGLLVSWAENIMTDKDETLRVWDGTNERCVTVLAGHTQEIVGAKLLSNKLLLSWSTDGTLRLWDCVSKAGEDCVHKHSVGGVSVLALDNFKVLSWSLASMRSYDRENEFFRSSDPIRVWDIRSGICVASIDGHPTPVNGAVSLTGGRFLTWANWPDFSLCLWSSENGACLSTR